MMSDCNHADGASFVGSTCVLCGYARRGRPRKQLGYAQAFAAGRASVEEPPPSGPRYKPREGLGVRDRLPGPYKRAFPDYAIKMRDVPNNPPLIDPAEHERRLTAQICRLSFAEFVKAGWHVVNPSAPLFWNWHMDTLCDHFQQMAENLLRARREPDFEMPATNLMVNIPPRCSKSMLVSVFLPAWLWLRDPALKIRCCSANPRVTIRDAQYCRDLIGSEWYRDTFEIQWQVRHDIDGVYKFANTARGERLGSTFASKVTGEGSDVLIIDDPHDASQVNSEKERTRVLDKWDAALESRVNDRLRCLRIGVMQRLHESDWCGHVLKGGNWVHLWIAMEFDANRRCTTRIGDWTWSDPRTQHGELLQPARFPLKELRGGDDPQGTGGMYYPLGSYGWAGQMQQIPAPADGGIFLRAWFHLIDETSLPEKFDDVVISADLANKAKDVDRGSFNVLTVAARKGKNYYILDVRRGRGPQWTPARTMERLREMSDEYRKRLGRIPKIIVEDKAMGPTVIDMMVSDARIPGVIEDDEAQKARDDKVSRALAISPLVEGKQVAVIKAPWTDDFLHELTTFPKSSHDDQVDTFSQALNYWRMSRGVAGFIAAYG